MRALVVAPQPFFSPRGTPFSVYYRTRTAAELGVEIDSLTYCEGQDVEIPGVRFHRIPAFRFLGSVPLGPSWLKLFLYKFLVAYAITLLLRRRLFVEEALRRELFTPEALAAMTTPTGEHVLRRSEEAGGRDEVDRTLHVDVKSYLVDNCLVKVDRMSMACSLETRVPLLDHELVELAFRMPSRLNVGGGATKILLKRVAAWHVRRECVYRPKQGFSIPIKQWLFGPLRRLPEELLDAARLGAEGLFRAETVERLEREHAAGRENHSHALWALLVFQDWRRRWAA